MLNSHQFITPSADLSTADIDYSDDFGNAIAITDVDGDDINDLVVGAYLYHNIYIIFLANDTTSVSFQRISMDSNFGSSIAALGDLDGDTVNDIVVGAYIDDDGGVNVGAVYILFLNQAGTYNSYQKISNDYGDFTAALADSDLFGISCSCAGDLNGDSVVDIAVGAYGDDDGGSNHGAVYIIFLETDGTCQSFQKISETAGSFTATELSYFGHSNGRVEDVNGDTINDLVVGTWSTFVIYIIFLTQTGEVLSHQMIGSSSGGFTASLRTDDEFGYSCSSAGDVNGDGVVDIMAGAFGDDDHPDGMTENTGAIYVLFLSQNGMAISHQKISAVSGDFTAQLWTGNNNGAYFGLSCTNGDMNRDGIVDLVVGAHANYNSGADNNDMGTVYILFVSQTFGKINHRYTTSSS